ncbi:hypothetical protein [Sphingomonas solaris]|uniref:Uncharacterized protein n=1 Tax=Alterirhizorhabdus solaris TaxID=2529389 RepID=A0A558R837_9SPHN|nr:hypothetical protein [Sphingomonas solaris]TVV75563.1 hypothetical protein FOY91_06800 [Sphingomonas solaris]
MGAGKPSLQDLANLPGFGTAAAGVRQHYDPQWKLFEVEDPESAIVWRVEVEWSETTYETETYDIRADTEEQAQKIARGRFDDDCPGSGGEIDIENVSASRVTH